MDQIPLVDLAIQHSQIADEVNEGFQRVMAEGSYVLGPEVAAFEREFAEFCGVAHCVGVANGTDALEIALRAAGVGSGDEVVLPANTFIATAGAVARTGARPVLVDCDPEYQLIDADAVESCVSPRTRAIMPVHLFGQVAPMTRLHGIAARHGLALIEDAAQAQGAEQEGRRAGGFGAVAGTSFYPGKNLGAYGDAGAVLTNDDELARRSRAIRNHGSEVRYQHPALGFNSRLDSLQAVVLRAKLRRLDAWNQERRDAADRYTKMLSEVPGVRPPATAANNQHVWHLYVVRVANRDDVLNRLQQVGIGAGIHYPVPVHLQGAFADLGHGVGDFPNAEAAAREILSLPLYPGITSAQQEQVVEALASAVGRAA